MKRGALPDLLLTKKERLIENVKIKYILGYIECDMVKFRIMRRGSRVKNKVTAIDFRKPVFGFFKDHLEEACEIKH